MEVEALSEELATWARESGVPSRDVQESIDRIKADGYWPLTKDGAIRLRAELMFRRLERIRIKGVPGTFNQAQFNQWWTLQWLLGDVATDIQNQEAVRGYPDKPSRDAGRPSA